MKIYQFVEGNYHNRKIDDLYLSKMELSKQLKAYLIKVFCPRGRVNY